MKHFWAFLQSFVSYCVYAYCRSRYEDGHSRDNERGRDYKDRDYDSAEYHERRQDRSQEKYTSKDKSKYSKLDRGDSLERSVKSKGSVPV